METLDLEDGYKEFIINSILKIIPNVEIYVYGSRERLLNIQMLILH